MQFTIAINVVCLCILLTIPHSTHDWMHFTVGMAFGTMLMSLVDDLAKWIRKDKR